MRGLLTWQLVRRPLAALELAFAAWRKTTLLMVRRGLAHGCSRGLAHGCIAAHTAAGQCACSRSAVGMGLSWMQVMH
jgi:hypothetical protein